MTAFICLAAFKIYIVVAASLVFAVAVYFLYRLIKASAPPVRRISLLCFIAALVAIEITPRMKGADPRFIIPIDAQSPFAEPVPVDSLMDYRVMVCDSYGVNKLSYSGQFASSVLPLNSDGFHSAYEFSPPVIDSAHLLGKEVVLLVGDSWTFGLNADSGYSFASLLDQTEKYRVLNAGIPGTDLLQYEAVVNEYITGGKIKPDRMVVCLSRNDLNPLPYRKLTPGVPMLYTTNAGGIYAFQGEDTVYSSARETYRSLYNKYTVAGILGEGVLAAVISKSVVASRLLGWLTGLVFLDEDAGEQPLVADTLQKSIAHIQQVCARANLPVLFILLPGKFNSGEETAGQLKGITVLNNNLLAPANYPTGADDHPDDDGHRKLFVAIKQILDSVRM